MKTVIEQAAAGIIEHKIPKIRISETSIAIEMEQNGFYHGTIDIDSENDTVFKTIVYSTLENVTIENPKYVGMHYTMKYLVSADTREASDVLHGEFHVVSDAGEYCIPYTITVHKPVIQTSYGSISNYDQFVRLVWRSAEEGRKVFQSPKFQEIVIGNNYQECRLYEGLMKQQDVGTAMEEFLVAIKKKERIQVSLLEESYEQSDLAESTRCIVHMSKNTWGHVDLSVSAKGEFIDEFKKSVGSEDFIGNRLNYYFTVRKERLHKGKNYGKLIFTTKNQVLELPILIHNDSTIDEKRKIQKKTIYELMECYLLFRMQKVPYPNWEEQSMRLVDRMRNNNESDLSVRLLKAQMCMIADKREEASWILDYVQSVLPTVKEGKLELNSYYLYLRALQKRNVEYTKDVVKSLRNVYDVHPCWEILWFLLYLDERFENNKSLKYSIIKDHCNKGCTSPMMYFEALNVLNGQPVLLRVLNHFEIQIMTLAVKRKFVQPKLAAQFAALAMKEKRFNKRILRILIQMYEMYQNNQILTAIVSMLIKGKCTDHSYFKWFELAVKNDLKIAKLYEYYIYSIDQKDMSILPQMLLMYFVYNTDSIKGREAYLFRNLIHNKQDIPQIYQGYMRAIEQFGIRQILKGNIDEHLAVIYDEILSKALLNDDIARRLPGIILTYKLSVKNPRMKYVIVLHKETKEEHRYLIKDGVSYVKVYTQQPTILFENEDGVRICDSTYELTRLLDMEYYLRLSYEIYPYNKYLRLHYGENYAHFKNNPEKYVSMFQLLMDIDDMDCNYKKELLKDILDYYYNNVQDEAMDRYLMNVELDRIEGESRNKMIQMMIMRGMYEEASLVLHRFGSAYVNVNYLFRFCTRMLERNSRDRDEYLVRFCYETYKKGLYDERTLRYLGRHYYGTLDEMLQIWHSCVGYELEHRELEERILVHGIFVHAWKKIGDLFAHYYENGAKDTICHAYINILSSYGMIYDTEYDEKLNFYIEKELSQKETMHVYSELHLLKHYSEQEQLETFQKRIAERLLRSFVEKNIVFEFFKKFSWMMDIPQKIFEQTVFTFCGSGYKQRSLFYRFGDDISYKEKVMEEVVPGIWNASLILFHGERVSYYIGEAPEEAPCVKELSNIVDKNQGSYCFRLINQMILAKQDEDEYKRLLCDYQKKREIAEVLF